MQRYCCQRVVMLKLTGTSTHVDCHLHCSLSQHLKTTMKQRIWGIFDFAIFWRLSITLTPQTKDKELRFSTMKSIVVLLEIFVFLLFDKSNEQFLNYFFVSVLKQVHEMESMVASQ